MRSFALTLLFALTFGTAFAQTPQYEPVLVPVHYNGPGAYDSYWLTDVSLFNTTDSNIELRGSVIAGGTECEGENCHCSRRNVLEANTLHAVCPELSDPAGLVFWVPVGTVDDIAMSARMRDARGPLSIEGIEVPLVRAADLHGGPVYLLNVPVSGQHRVTLRLADVYETFPEARIRVYDSLALAEGDRELIAEKTFQMESRVTIKLTPIIEATSPNAFLTIPDLVDAIPEIAGHRLVTLEIQGSKAILSPPQPDGFYAMASVTNNETRDVTIITPQ